MKRKLSLIGAVLCLSALPVLAQHDHSAPGHTHDAKPPTDAAMMEAMMKAGTPGEAQKRLDAMTGTWDTKVSFWMFPGAEPATSAGVSTAQWVLGGRYLEQRFKGDMGGMPFEGIGYTGYDNTKKQYWGTWMDNMSTSMMTSTGSLSADGKVWEFDATMTDPMTGKDTTAKEKITVHSADHHTMEMWGPGPDGKMFKNLEIQYTRKK
ncbi:MAG TPA: DUF1579 domain-containing protein [Thermoanaerobaculia bacterium]|jgi:hypothetical protein|nr:DUF1579 domain-containing protein [Thermoanaerobaculia bacterium]